MPRRSPYADMFAASSVIAWRTAMLGAAALHPTPARSREIARRFSEKSAAAVLGMFAWQQAWMKSGWEQYAAAIAPGTRTMRANARRLRRRKKL